MLIPEARWYGRQMRKRRDELFPMLNLGSQTLAFRTEIQPWLDRYLFAPARSLGLKVVHSDMQAAEGVDLVGDLSEPAFRDQLASMRFQSVLCSNLLEHVEHPELVAQTVAQIVPPGGYLLVSAPYRFPYHPDPIDTMFRPSPRELAALFPQTDLIEATIIRGGNLSTYALQRLISHPGRVMADARAKWRSMTMGATTVSLPLPTSKTTSADRGRWHWLPWLVRPFEISCVVLRKRPS